MIGQNISSWKRNPFNSPPIFTISVSASRDKFALFPPGLLVCWSAVSGCLLINEQCGRLQNTGLASLINSNLDIKEGSCEGISIREGLRTSVSLIVTNEGWKYYHYWLRAPRVSDCTIVLHTFSLLSLTSWACIQRVQSCWARGDRLHSIGSIKQLHNLHRIRLSIQQHTWIVLHLLQHILFTAACRYSGLCSVQWKGEKLL